MCAHCTCAECESAVLLSVRVRYDFTILMLCEFFFLLCSAYSRIDGDHEPWLCNGRKANLNYSRSIVDTGDDKDIKSFQIKIIHIIGAGSFEHQSHTHNHNAYIYNSVHRNCMQ